MKKSKTNFYKIVDVNGRKAFFPITDPNEIEYYQDKSITRMVQIDNKLYEFPSNYKNIKKRSRKK